MLGSHGSLDKEGGPLFSPGIPRANAVMGSAVRPRQGAIDRALATDHNVLSRRIKFKPAARPDKQVLLVGWEDWGGGDCRAHRERWPHRMKSFGGSIRL